MRNKRSRLRATVAAVVRLEVARDHAIEAAKTRLLIWTQEARRCPVSRGSVPNRRLIEASSDGFGIFGPSIPWQSKQVSGE